MFKVRVERVVAQDIDAVFDKLTDHEGYTRFSGVTAARLLAAGADERSGTGALREIHGGGLRFVERITAFERPTRMGYRIEQSSPLPIRHDKGQIDLRADGAATHVVWISEGHFDIPLVGDLLDRLAQPRIERMFGRLLRSLDA